MQPRTDRPTRKSVLVPPPHYQINNVLIFCEKPSDFTRHAATAASAQTPACWFLSWARLVIVHAAFPAEQLALDTPPPSLLAPRRAPPVPPKLAAPPQVGPGYLASDRPRDSEHSVGFLKPLSIRQSNIVGAILRRGAFRRRELEGPLLPAPIATVESNPYSRRFLCSSGLRLIRRTSAAYDFVSETLM